MAKRKALTKSIRFEVFKRDHFTCQYCGRKAPDVVLEVDHIIPVAEGGDNDLINLVTSCLDCNRGKGKKKLDDTSAVIKQRLEMERMAERQEQVKMLVTWKKEIEDTDNYLIEYLTDYWISLTGYEPPDAKTMRSYYNRFGFEEVYESIEIALDRYYRDDDESADFAYKKIGGICYNRKKQREHDAEQDN